jgi:type IV secretion system protein VirB9
MFIIKYIIAIFVLCQGANATVNNPVAIDSRIKTLVYSPNEIFQLKFIVGYQSIIELEKDEAVELISFGDPLPWNVKIIDKRIFVKALDPGVKTNMTVITNKRTYLLEISSNSIDDNYLDDQLVYVVRFFYPELDIDAPQPFKIKTPSLSTSLPRPSLNAQSNRTENLNFQYTFAGTGTKILPIRVFDNGRQTFLQFADNNQIVPAIYAVNPDGTESRLKTKLVDDYVVIDTSEYQLSLRYGKELICLFNERLLNPQSVESK